MGTGIRVQLLTHPTNTHPIPPTTHRNAAKSSRPQTRFYKQQTVSDDEIVILNGPRWNSSRRKPAESGSQRRPARKVSRPERSSPSFPRPRLGSDRPGWRRSSWAFVVSRCDECRWGTVGGWVPGGVVVEIRRMWFLCWRRLFRGFLNGGVEGNLCWFVDGDRGEREHEREREHRLGHVCIFWCSWFYSFYKGFWSEHFFGLFRFFINVLSMAPLHAPIKLSSLLKDSL